MRALLTGFFAIVFPWVLLFSQAPTKSQPSSSNTKGTLPKQGSIVPSLNTDTVKPVTAVPSVGPQVTGTVGKSALKLYGGKASKVFAGQYFKMATVLSPYTPGIPLTMIKGSSLLKFLESGAGFKPPEYLPLPSPPLEDDFLAGMVGNQARAYRMATGATGYQLGVNSEVLWVGAKKMFVNTNSGWKVRWIYPTVEGAGNNRDDGIFGRGGLVVISKDRVAFFDDSKNFITIYELGEEATAAGQVIAKIAYEEIGCTPESFPSYAKPTFCIYDDLLYFHLNNTGRFFKLDLNSFKLTEFDVPWAYQEFGDKPMMANWMNAGGSDVAAPVTPAFFEFIPSPDGNLFVGALMYNSQSSVRGFVVNRESNTIQAKLLDEEFASCLKYYDVKGEFACIPKE